MASSFGRGFDSLQLHFKANESSDYQSFFFIFSLKKNAENFFLRILIKELKDNSELKKKR